MGFERSLAVTRRLRPLPTGPNQPGSPLCGSPLDNPPEVLAAPTTGAALPKPYYEEHGIVLYAKMAACVNHASRNRYGQKAFATTATCGSSGKLIRPSRRKMTTCAAADAASVAEERACVGFAGICSASSRVCAVVAGALESRRSTSKDTSGIRIIEAGVTPRQHVARCLLPVAAENSHENTSKGAPEAGRRTMLGKAMASPSAPAEAAHSGSTRRKRHA